MKAPTTVRILGVKVTGMPFIDPSTGSGWDPNTGPDVYFTLNDVNDNVLFTSNSFNNVTAANLPLLWTLTPTYTITNFSSTYKLRVYDQDMYDVPPSAYDYIGGYQFTLSSYAANGYPVVATLSSTSSSLKIELVLDWQ